MPNSLSFLLSELNEEQQKAVAHTDGPVLILAGAGSGKTRALIYRTAYLIREIHIPIDRILLVTFTNKAATEMQSRLRSLIDVRLPFAGTFHSFCARLLRIEGRHINLQPSFVIYDETDRQSAIKQAMLALSIDPKEISIRSISYAISAAKNELLSVDDYVSFSRGTFQEKVALVYKEYQSTLTKAHAVDFDDLLYLSFMLLSKITMVREKYQEQFLHVLVDEYQDTNKAQYELTKLLSAKHQNLCVVGDASQSIYKFRGADHRNIMSLKRDFPSLTTYQLTRNYRSSQTILDAAYGVISNNTSHPVLQLWTDKTAGDPLVLYTATDEKTEASFVLSSIRAMLSSNPSWSLSDFCVLYRTNAQSRVFEEVFLRASIPYTLVGGVEFFQRKEVKDVLAFVRVALNADDFVSEQRAHKVGKRRLSSWMSFLQTNDAASMTPLDLLNAFLTSTNYLQLYNAEDSEDLSRIENIKELLSVASEFPTITSFLDNVALIQNKTMPDGSQLSKEDGVNLMTLHASKGLEFKVVFLVGLEEGLFPHSRALMDREEMEEERRLCYVGITRAKEKLYLSFAERRLLFGSYGSNSPSRFLSEIPSSLLSTDKQSRRPLEDDGALDKLLSDEIDIDEFLDF